VFIDTNTNHHACIETSSFSSIYLFRQQAREKDEEKKTREKTEREEVLLLQLQPAGEFF
jgi:hypothetical protein